MTTTLDDSSIEPGMPATDVVHVRTWFGHPRQLARLFSIEAWERFGYYGMRALLTLYLTKHFIFGDREATGLYGGYTALVYLTPLVGGLLADQYLGSKRAVKFGAIMMAIGYLVLSFTGRPAEPYALIDGQRHAIETVNASWGPSTRADERRLILVGGEKLVAKVNIDGSVDLLRADGSLARTVAKGGFETGAERNPVTVAILLLALSTISVGNGFFKPNISTMVGELYSQGDRRRDSGFTIFYMGINVGSTGGQILCPAFADLFGWWAGFLVVAVGMMVSWTLISFDGGRLAGYGDVPQREGKDRALIIYALAVLTVPLFYLLYVNLMNAPAPAEGAGFVGYILALPLMGKLLFGAFLIGVPAILIWSFAVGSKTEFQMMLAAMVLITFNVFFWMLFEQAGSSLTLFADRNTDLSVFGFFSISAPQTQNFNPISIIIFAPILSIIWGALARRNLEPSIPVKFAIALLGVGAGFLFLVWGTSFAGPDFKVSLWWLAGLYVIHSISELCISPVGLSMITKLSIARVVGLMMGVWFLSISVAQYVAGVVAQFASVETVGGQVTNLQLSLETYTATFSTIAYIAIGMGLALFVLSWPLKHWMHGVK